MQSIGYSAFDVIIVDNGSIGIQNFIEESRKAYKMEIKWLTNTVKKNPYVSRNIGIRAAESTVIAFLDAACVPDPEWIKVGCQKIEEGYTIVAGQFKLTYPSAKLRDKVHGLLYLNNRKNVEKGYGVPCGNLFVKQALFDTIGPFGEDHISGQDIVWTRRALFEGYKIAYGALCIVEYPAFSYVDLLQKMKKYGRGVRHHRHYVDRNVSIDGFRGTLPMRWSNFSSALTYRGLDQLSVAKKVYLWMLVWRAKVAYTLA